MPMYTFRVKETGEVFEELFTYDQKKAFLTDNPEYEEVIGAPAIISGISGVTHKTDGGFKDLLNRIGNANPLSRVGQEHGDKSIKSVKTRQAVEKAKTKK